MWCYICYEILNVRMHERIYCEFTLRTLLVYWWLDYENVFTAIKKGFLTTFAFDFFGLKLSDQFLGYKIRTKFTPIAKLVQIECYICYENFNVRMHERICCKFVLRTSLIFWLFNYENVFTALKKAFWQHLHSIFWGLKLSVQFLSYKIRTKFTPIAKSVQMWCYRIFATKISTCECMSEFCCEFVLRTSLIFDVLGMNIASVRWELNLTIVL
jgi:hypothetical protein